MTPGEWEAMFERQGRRCASCPATSPGPNQRWQTDHDHKTGRVRGILCVSCNVLVGTLENPRRALAEAYLARTAA